MTTIVRSTNNDSIFRYICIMLTLISQTEGAGAVGTGHGKTTKKVKKQSNVHRGQRKSKAIKIESFRNKNIEGAVEGLLPSGSREATPSTEPVPTAQPQLQVDDKSFFAGSPFVEVTKGIIHMYKNK